MNLQRAWTESIAGSRQADRRAEISYRTGQILHMLYHTTCHSLLLGRENVREKLVCLVFFLGSLGLVSVLTLRLAVRRS